MEFGLLKLSAVLIIGNFSLLPWNKHQLLLRNELAWKRTHDFKFMGYKRTFCIIYMTVLNTDRMKLI